MDYYEEKEVNAVIDVEYDEITFDSSPVLIIEDTKLS